ncbi:hypothetical protein DPMN_180559 [Dreissena polymorpha]|uniref:Uncharacterized protein n=1 Tax=Dreissena polymorpha TaxID=45954 RepID=A0A9D4EGE5_DREPO|nr:hypothetical protein DPMN_180559 [Dreissena polymorpha]
MWKVKPDSDQWAVRVGGDQAGTLPTKKARPGLIRVESKSINSESENGAKTTPCLIGRDPRALNAHVQVCFYMYTGISFSDLITVETIFR